MRLIWEEIWVDSPGKFSELCLDISTGRDVDIMFAMSAAIVLRVHPPWPLIANRPSYLKRDENS